MSSKISSGNQKQVKHQLKSFAPCSKIGKKIGSGGFKNLYTKKVDDSTVILQVK